MLQADSIIYDVKKIAEYQSDKDYDYGAQLETPDYSIWDMIMDWFNRLMMEIFQGKYSEKYTAPILISVFVLIVAAIVYFIYLKRPELFLRAKRTGSLQYDIEEENIHAIDFDTEIAKALSVKDFRYAVRLVYLQTLRFLSEQKLIDWQIHKTPTDYRYELQNLSMKPHFSELTNEFLKVRYGNYDASATLFEKMQSLQNAMKGGIE
ncbi:MAG: DUF4129 domain-containing protein [Tannerella sp.]|jgi:hypothetical protein|nr:DUF4129 domain-containing protein [Tannerella sp.]